MENLIWDKPYNYKVTDAISNTPKNVKCDKRHATNIIRGQTSHATNIISDISS